MIRSNFALRRVLLIPYGMLLALYLAVVGGGGAWLYFEIRAGETRMLMQQLVADLRPLVERLKHSDTLLAGRDDRVRWTADIERLFVSRPALRVVTLRGPDAGFRVENDGAGGASYRPAPPLAADAQRAATDRPARLRLRDESDAMFTVGFDLTPAGAPLVRLDFSFDRAMLLAQVDAATASIRRSIALFSAAGAVSIVIALGITLLAMRTTRTLEGHFQETYQRASLTETAAQLVHDLRNPLAALRANVKALLLSPQQIPEIVEELDDDIVSLNEKLSAFLNLTRQRDEQIEAVDVEALIVDAVRLAEPMLSRHGIAVQIDAAPKLPRPHWQAASMRDALLNVILNAAQSGQQGGTVEVSVQQRDDAIEIVVADRGDGIAAADLPRLFDAFFTTRDDGNGLGLAIVKGIVSAHQGHVRAENRAGGGARITLCLPLQRKEPPHWWTRLRKHSRA